MVNKSNRGIDEMTQGDRDQYEARMGMAIKLMAINQMATRAGLGRNLGTSFGGSRDLYEALGYPTDITFKDYYGKYSRSGYGKRVIVAYPDACWNHKPTVFDNADAGITTTFEEEWATLTKMKRIWSTLQRTDRLSGIGRFGGILLGIDDGMDWTEPADMRQGVKRRELLYMTPMTEGQLAVEIKETDKENERYGLPLIYQVQLDSASTVLKVHWTRIIHVAEELVDSEVYGTPRLEPVYNNIIDLEKLTGGSAEMFWRGAFPGMAFNMDSDAEFTPADMEQLKDSINDYIHGSTRALRLQGVTPHEFTPVGIDPKNHVDVQLMEISAATGIPKRILIGTEEGRLAGDQDGAQWEKRVNGRSVDYCEPTLVRGLIDRLIDLGVMPVPSTGEYTVEYPEVSQITPSQESQISKDKIEMMKNYVQGGLDAIITVETFLDKFIGLDAEEIEAITKEIGGLLEQERLDAEERARQEAADADAEQDVDGL